MIGVPLGAYLAFNKDMGLKGLIIGQTLGGAIQAALYLAIILRTDMSKKVQEARDRIAEENKENQVTTKATEDDF
jgi:Na+-driven multidrug efflux pump